MKRFLGFWGAEAKEWLKETDGKKRREILKGIVAEMNRRIDYINQEEAALKEGKCARLADRCVFCGSYARMAGTGYCSLLGAYRYGPYICWKCRISLSTPDKLNAT